MNESDVYRYSSRYAVDMQVHAMRERIQAERRGGIGIRAARQEAIEVTATWWRDEYMRIEREVTARWGMDA